MPIGSVRLVPGVNTERTPTLNEAGVSVSNLIRSRDGLIEKLGGWARYFAFAIESVVRALSAWQDLINAKHLALGATQSLNVITSGVLTNITPQTATTNNAPNFSTVNGFPAVTIVDAGAKSSVLNYVHIKTPIVIGGITLFGTYPIATVIGATTYTITAASSATSTVNNAGVTPQFVTAIGASSVTVNWAAHGKAVGENVTFLVSTAVGGCTIFGDYTIQSVPGANSFTVFAATVATANDTVSENGGNAQIVYYVNLGPQSPYSGYSIGPYSSGGWGTGSPVATGSGTPITATDWSLDNWGEQLIACPSGGGLYYWPPNSGYDTAVLIGAGPLVNGGAFVAMPQRILVAWGSTSTGIQDPLLLRWSDVSNYFVWAATSQTQAGSYRIANGSRIVGALQAPRQALIFTDISVWSMQYVGAPLVFGFNEVGRACGLIGQHAAGVMNGVVYWMGQGQFFRLVGGQVQAISCAVWDAVFQNISTTHQNKCVCAINSQFDEVAWYYPSVNATEPDLYVKYDTAENTWDYGTLSRTAWIDQTVLGQPIGTDNTNSIFQHETSKNADGGSVNSSFMTGYFMLSEGNDRVFVDQIIPDFKWGTFPGSGNAVVYVTVYAINNMDDTPRIYGPYQMTQSTSFATCRIRARQLAFKFESSDINSFWRVGRVRYRYAPDGRL